MKAVICPQYGPPEVLKVVEMEKPAPKANEVLIKIAATTVHRGDTRIRGLDVPGPGIMKLMARLFLGFNRPKNPVLGMELSGTVESTGSSVTRFKPGDEVMAATLWDGFGAYAGYKCMPQDSVIAVKPTQISFEEAAAIPCGGVTALKILKKAHIRSLQKVLILGASGSLGSYAVQMAKSLGAEVTAVCSTSNVAMVRALGADHVMDYTADGFQAALQTYDVIFDAVDRFSASEMKKKLSPKGIYLNAHQSSDGLNRKNALELLLELKTMIEAGRLKAVIDRTLPLEQAAEGHRYVEQGHKKGHVILKI